MIQIVMLVLFVKLLYIFLCSPHYLTAMIAKSKLQQQHTQQQKKTRKRERRTKEEKEEEEEKRKY